MANEKKRITLDSVDISYQVAGSGPQALLLIHGAVGSTNDFAIQLADDEYGLDKRKFTLVALDLPGCGQSAAPPSGPDVRPTLEYFEFCAHLCGKLMDALGFKTYSVGGWSDGARVACLLAIERQSRINSLVLWGFVPVMDERSAFAIARTRDTRTWEPQVLQFYSAVYGDDFADLWKGYVDYVIRTLELPDRFDIRSRLRQIKCPTMVLHGGEDPIVNFREHVKPIEMQIFDSEIVRFKSMAHNIHQADPLEFSRVLDRLVDSASG